MIRSVLYFLTVCPSFHRRYKKKAHTKTQTTHTLLYNQTSKQKMNPPQKKHTDTNFPLPTLPPPPLNHSKPSHPPPLPPPPPGISVVRDRGVVHAPFDPSPSSSPPAHASFLAGGQKERAKTSGQQKKRRSFLSGRATRTIPVRSLPLSLSSLAPPLSPVRRAARKREGGECWSGMPVRRG